MKMMKMYLDSRKSSQEGNSNELEKLVRPKHFSINFDNSYNSYQILSIFNEN